MLMHKTWNFVKPRTWLASPTTGAQQSPDSSLILSMMLQAFHWWQAVTHIQGSVQAG